MKERTTTPKGPAKDPTEEFATHGYVDDALAAQYKTLNSSLESLYNQLMKRIEAASVELLHNLNRDVKPPAQKVPEASPAPRDFKREIANQIAEAIVDFEASANNALIVTRLDISRVGRSIGIEPTITLR